MVPESHILLHASQEVEFVEYLYRVVGYLVAFGGVAGLSYWLAGVVDPGQSRFGDARDGDEVER